MIRTWLAMQLDDSDLPEHYVIGHIDDVQVSLQVRVGASSSVLNPVSAAEKIAAALHNAGLS